MITIDLSRINAWFQGQLKNKTGDKWSLERLYGLKPIGIKMKIKVCINVNTKKINSCVQGNWMKSCAVKEKVILK